MKILGIILLISILHFSLFSCISFHIVSRGYMEDNIVIDKRSGFYLEPIKVTSFNFKNDDEIAFIMDKKLVFAINSNHIGLAKEKDKSDYIILPELIINSYEEKYNQINYYYFSIKIISSERTLCHFSYEYNGMDSIFDGKVQNIMIKKCIDDLLKL
jgi:hypothetical protein